MTSAKYHKNGWRYSAKLKTGTATFRNGKRESSYFSDCNGRSMYGKESRAITHNVPQLPVRAGHRMKNLIKTKNMKKESSEQPKKKPALRVGAVLHSALIYCLDFWAAIRAWLFIWFDNDAHKLQRRVKFVNDVLSEKRKAMLPYRMWIAAFRAKGIV